MRVLIVDDDALNRKLLKSMLNSFGDCETAESGSQAIEAFTNAWNKWRPFDVIFLDLMMPEMDGKEALINIREMEKERQVAERLKAKVFMVTAAADKESILACVKAGCDSYIVKPVERQAIVKKLGEFELLKQD